MTKREIIKAVKDTLYQLEKNAGKCLEERDFKHADNYLMYAERVRMALCSMEVYDY